MKELWIFGYLNIFGSIWTPAHSRSSKKLLSEQFVYKITIHNKFILYEYMPTKIIENKKSKCVNVTFVFFFTTLIFIIVWLSFFSTHGYFERNY